MVSGRVFGAGGFRIKFNWLELLGKHSSLRYALRFGRVRLWCGRRHLWVIWLVARWIYFGWNVALGMSLSHCRSWPALSRGGAAAMSGLHGIFYYGFESLKVSGITLLVFDLLLTGINTSVSILSRRSLS